MSLVLKVIGVLAAVALPRLQMGAVSKQTAKTFAHQLTADLRYTRQLALTNDAVSGVPSVNSGSPARKGKARR